MISLIASAILGLSILGAGVNVVSSNTAANEIVVQSSGDNLTNIQWHNNRSLLANDENSMSLFEQYDVDSYEASRSMDVLYSRRVFAI